MHSATATPGCPKRMVFGPCGGVRADGGCEMIAIPCVFAGLPEPVPWPDAMEPGRRAPRPWC